MSDDNIETAIESLAEVIESFDSPSEELIDLCELYLRRADHARSRDRTAPSRARRYH